MNGQLISFNQIYSHADMRTTMGFYVHTIPLNYTRCW